MKKATAARHTKSTNGHKVAHELSTTVESALPTGSWQRVAVGVAAAAGGGLLAATVIGVGPAALAGAAGYLAYRGMQHK